MQNVGTDKGDKAREFEKMFDRDPTGIARPKICVGGHNFDCLNRNRFFKKELIFYCRKCLLTYVKKKHGLVEIIFNGSMR